MREEWVRETERMRNIKKENCIVAIKVKNKNKKGKKRISHETNL